MPKEKRITYMGETKSISAWIRVLGLNRNVVFSRLHKGWDVNRAFAEPVSSGCHGAKEIEYMGETHSMSAWARQLGCSVSQLSKRLRSGMSVEEALTKPFTKRNQGCVGGQLIEFQGKKQSLSEWAREKGINFSTLYGRLRKGWSVERMLSADTEGHADGRRLEYKGKVQTISEWASELGMSRGLIYDRLRKGWCIDRVLGGKVSDGSAKKRMVTINGKTQSVVAWARELGLKISTVYGRLQKGWSAIDALSNTPKLHASLIEYKGERKTIVEWATAYGLKVSLLRKRLRLGWTIEKALTTPMCQGRTKTYYYKGTEKTLADWAVESGVSKKLLQDRLNRGWSIERAIETPAGDVRQARMIKFRGKECSLHEISLMTGISMSTISDRLRKGWEIERAVSEPPDKERSKSQNLEINGEIHTVTEWAKLKGVPSRLILQRMAIGWPAEKAVMEPVGKRKYHDITFRGQTLSMSAWARLFGLKFNTLSQRIRAGWSIEDALTSDTQQKRHSKKSGGRAKERKPHEKPYLYNGQRMSGTEFAAALNIPRGTLYYFVKKGFSQEQIINRAINGARDERGHLVQEMPVAYKGRYVYKGEHYTMKQLAKMWGINVTVFAKYKARGFSVNDLIACVEKGDPLPPLFAPGSGRGRGRPRKEITIVATNVTEDFEMLEYAGMKMSYRDFATKLGVTVVYVERMLEMGMSPEEIARVTSS